MLLFRKHTLFCSEFEKYKLIFTLLNFIFTIRLMFSATLTGNFQFIFSRYFHAPPATRRLL